MFLNKKHFEKQSQPHNHQTFYICFFAVSKSQL
jgi:hypothetical protein